MSEPRSREDVAAWVARRVAASDRFRRVYEESERHREEHGAGCTVYPSGSGPLLGVLATATRPARTLEVGCGLGYSALWLAYGSGGFVETIEEDELHVRLAREHHVREGFDDRILIHHGRGAEILPGLDGPYGFVFADGDPSEYLVDLDQFLRLLGPGGLLVTANLFLGVFGDLPGLETAAEYRERILADDHFLTVFLSSGTALSVRR